MLGKTINFFFINFVLFVFLLGALTVKSIEWIKKDFTEQHDIQIHKSEDSAQLLMKEPFAETVHFTININGEKQIVIEKSKDQNKLIIYKTNDGDEISVKQEDGNHVIINKIINQSKKEDEKSCKRNTNCLELDN